MGLNPDVTKLLEHLIEWKGLSIIEFGDQLISPGSNRPAREWYLELGVSSYDCIDLNGQHGAIQRDIRGDLSDLGQFDVVTNLGTLEHVDNGIEGQIQGFKAMHSLCKIGGYVINHVPMLEFHRGHSPVLYTPQFLDVLYRANDYQQLLDFDNHIYGCVGRCYRKLSDREFVFPEEAIAEILLFPNEGCIGDYS